MNESWAFDNRLQSLRGIAALMVAIGHCLTILTNSQLPDAATIPQASNAALIVAMLVCQPHTAVVFFYVLSGYVLGASLRRNGIWPLPERILEFAIRRLARMMPVLWLSMLVAAALYSWSGVPDLRGTTGWFLQLYHPPSNGAELALNLLGIKYEINPVMWSVQVELTMIPILPLFAIVIAGGSFLIDLMMIALLAAISMRFFGRAPNAVGYLYCFYLGMMLHRCTGIGFVGRFCRRLGLLAVTAAVLVAVDLAWYLGRIDTTVKFAIDTAASAQIIFFVLLRRDSHIARVLDRPWLRLLGDISYSFYAFALVIMCAVSLPILHALPPSGVRYADVTATELTALIIVLTVSLSVAVSVVTYRYLELPGIALGRYVVQRLRLVAKANQMKRVT